MHKANGEHPYGDIGQIIALFIFLIVWITDSFILHLSTFLLNEAPLIVRLSIMTVILIPVYYLIQSGHRVVPRQKKTDDLVTTGAFRYVRHPLYLASLLTYLALSIITASLISMAIFIGIFIFHDYIAAYEEKLLEMKYGKIYSQYRDKTGKWIPRILNG
ncbi:isoprenylcysteine carboxylmethyltransferase family protein [bacterium]|nr:isoprenylcysteine carboxylmethyltransferase family protein [bacterium]